MHSLLLTGIHFADLNLYATLFIGLRQFNLLSCPIRNFKPNINRFIKKLDLMFEIQFFNLFQDHPQRDKFVEIK